MTDELITLLCTEGRTVVNRYVRGAEVRLEVVASSTTAPTLSRDDDDPVSSARPVEGGSTSVLDDGDVLDVVGVDRRERVSSPLSIGEDRSVVGIHRHPVDYVERVITCVDRA